MKRAFGALVLAAALFSCGNPGSSVVAPTSLDGEELFSFRALGSKPGCVTCHSLKPDRVLVGPSLAELSERAASTVPGLSDTDYVRTSIIEPQAHEGDEQYASQMPSGYGETLSVAQIDALVNFLLERS